MTSTELKKRILKDVESLEKQGLEEVYGTLQNILNSKKNLGDWANLTLAEKKGLQEAINELNDGKGISNEKALKNFRRKFNVI